MVRLLVYYSIKYGIVVINKLRFSEIYNCTSEVLISSPFIKVKENLEGYTHVNIAFGDFTMDFESKGEININEALKTIGIIEAKMGSNLSQGTKHAKRYNQVTWNIACMLHNVKDDSCKLYFGVLAPQNTIKKYDFKSQIDSEEVFKHLKERDDSSKVFY